MVVTCLVAGIAEWIATAAGTTRTQYVDDAGDGLHARVTCDTCADECGVVGLIAGSDVNVAIAASTPEPHQGVVCKSLGGVRMGSGGRMGIAARAAPVPDLVA